MNFLISKQEIETFKRLNIRQILEQIVAASYSTIHMYIVWKFICCLLNNDSPIVCVLSESMEPGFRRGDILFLKPQPFKNGDICVYELEPGTIPIVHRVISKKNNKIITKGDNNRLNDIGLYRKNKKYLEIEDTRSGVFGFIPYFGLPTIWISSVPGLRMLILVGAGISVLFTRQ